MNYKNMAQTMMGGNPYLPPDTRYGGHGFQLNAVQPGPGWPMIGRGPMSPQSGGYSDFQKGGTSSFSKNNPSLQEIILQIMQGMQTQPRNPNDLPPGTPVGTV